MRGRRRLDEEQVVREPRRRADGHRGQQLRRQRLPEILRHPHRMGGHGRNPAPHQAGHLRPRRGRKGPEVGQDQLQRGLRLQRRQEPGRHHQKIQSCSARPGLGLHHQNDPDYPGHPVRQPQAGRNGLARGGAGPQRGRGRLPGAAPVDRLAAERRFQRGDSGFHLRLERPEAADALRHGERHLQLHLHAARHSGQPQRAGIPRRAHLLEPGGV